MLLIWGSMFKFLNTCFLIITAEKGERIYLNKNKEK